MPEIRIKLPGFDTAIHPIHRAGWPLIFIFAFVTLVFFLISNPLGWFGVIATCWCVFFFRDPTRIPPEDTNAVISPADGMVQLIEKATPPEELGMADKELTRVSIFLNVFDVHVNRAPMSGKIKALHYRPGKFFNASLDKASTDNERMSILMETKNKDQIAFTQIAGLVARRIICNLKDAQEVQAGDRFGIIRFGSRMDVYLPDGVTPRVKIGQKMIGGESVLAYLNAKTEVKKTPTSKPKTTAKKAPASKADKKPASKK